MRLDALLGLALLASPSAALAQGANDSVSLIIMNPAVTLPATGSRSYDSTYTPYQAKAGSCTGVSPTLTGSDNILDPTTGCASYEGQVNLTDNSGNNTLRVGTGMQMNLANAGASLWKTETFDLTVLLTKLNCLKKNGCRPSSVLSVTGNFAETQLTSPGGVYYYLQLTGAPLSQTTLAGILAAGKGAILP